MSEQPAKRKKAPMSPKPSAEGSEGPPPAKKPALSGKPTSSQSQQSEQPLTSGDIASSTPTQLHAPVADSKTTSAVNIDFPSQDDLDITRQFFLLLVQNRKDIHEMLTTAEHKMENLQAAFDAANSSFVAANKRITDLSTAHYNPAFKDIMVKWLQDGIDVQYVQNYLKQPSALEVFPKERVSDMTAQAFHHGFEAGKELAAHQMAQARNDMHIVVNAVRKNDLHLVVEQLNRILKAQWLQDPAAKLQ